MDPSQQGNFYPTNPYDQNWNIHGNYQQTVPNGHPVGFFPQSTTFQFSTNTASYSHQPNQPNQRYQPYQTNQLYLPNQSSQSNQLYLPNQSSQSNQLYLPVQPSQPNQSQYMTTPQSSTHTTPTPPPNPPAQQLSARRFSLKAPSVNSDRHKLFPKTDRGPNELRDAFYASPREEFQGRSFLEFLEWSGRNQQELRDKLRGEKKELDAQCKALKNALNGAKAAAVQSKTEADQAKSELNTQQQENAKLAKELEDAKAQIVRLRETTGVKAKVEAVEKLTAAIERHTKAEESAALNAVGYKRRAWESDAVAKMVRECYPRNCKCPEGVAGNSPSGQSTSSTTTLSGYPKDSVAPTAGQKRKIGATSQEGEQAQPSKRAKKAPAAPKPKKATPKKAKEATRANIGQALEQLPTTIMPDSADAEVLAMHCSQAAEALHDLQGVPTFEAQPNGGNDTDKKDDEFSAAEVENFEDLLDLLDEEEDEGDGKDAESPAAGEQVSEARPDTGEEEEGDDTESLYSGELETELAASNGKSGCGDDISAEDCRGVLIIIGETPKQKKTPVDDGLGPRSLHQPPYQRYEAKD